LDDALAELTVGLARLEAARPVESAALSKRLAAAARLADELRQTVAATAAGAAGTAARAGAGRQGRLDGLLNRCAADTLAELPAETQALLRDYADQAALRRRPRSWERDAAGRLLEAGALWRPPGEARARPAARALLLEKACPEARYLLRGCLVCAPLAKEVLSRCFDLEAQERAVCWAARGDVPVPAVLRDRLSSFETGDRLGEAAFYPP